MRGGPQPAASGLMLDYITPMNAITLVGSIKAKHWMTATAVTGTLSLQILVLLSTGLFTSRPTTIVYRTLNGTLRTTFDAQNYKTGTNASDIPTMGTEAEVYSANSSKPWDLYLATSEYNMTYPGGTTDRYVYQQFDHIASDNSTVSALVDVFSADLLCETASVVNMTTQEYGGADVWTLASSECSNITIAPESFQYSDNPTDMVFATPGACNNTGQGDTSMRLAFLAGSFRLEAIKNDKPITEPSSANYSSYTSIICQPAYTIRAASVSWNSSASDDVPSITFPSIFEPRQLSDLSAWDIARPIPYTFRSKYYNYNGGDYWSGSGNTSIVMTFTEILNATEPQILASAFQDADTLSSAASSFFRSWTAQYAGLYLAVPSDQKLVLNTTGSEDRLYTRGPSLWISEAALIILVITAIFLLFDAPRTVMSRDPSSIGGQATILACSPSLMQALSLSNEKNKAAQEKLQGFEFSLCLNEMAGDVHIEASKLALADSDSSLLRRNSTEEASARDPVDAGVEFFVPFATTKFAMVVMILAPLCVIIALEVLYRYSQNHYGLTDVPIATNVHYAWTYVPAIVMTGLKLLYGSLESVVKSFQPFHAFHQGAASTNVGLLDNYLGQTALQTLLTAGLKKQWATIAVALSSLASPFLTIFVSGLFEARDATDQARGRLQRADQFNSSMADSYKSSIEANVILDSANTAYPQGTYDTLALAQFQLQTSTGTVAQNNTGLVPQLRATVPALRGVANCTAFAPEEILSNVYTPSPGENVKSSMIFTAVPPHENCNLPGADDKTTYWPYSGKNVSFYSSFHGSPSYFGSWFEVDSNIESSGLIDAYLQEGYSQNRTYFDAKPDCPRVYTFYYSVANNETTAFYCYPYVEQVDVVATYTLPELDLDYDNPPVPDESTAKFFSNAMATYLDQTFTPITASGVNETWDDTYFYDVLLYGRNAPSDPSEFAGKANADKLNAAINELYGLVMASYLNTQRISPSKDDYYEATILDLTQPRLFQDRTSTRVLQSLLALMTVCAVVAFATMDTRHILPVNPNSIGAVASLLAGSDMLDRKIIPAGAEWMSDKELRREGVYSGYFFSLGRFGEGARRKFGIDVGRAEKVGK